MAFNQTGFISNAISEGYTQEEINEYLRNKFPKDENPKDVAKQETPAVITPELKVVGLEKTKEEPKVDAVNDDTAMLMSAGKGVAMTTANKTKAMELLKKLPIDKLKFLAKTGGTWLAKAAGTILNAGLAAGESYLDAKSGKMKQTGNYAKDFGNAFSSYIDSILFNAPELISKKVFNKTPYRENSEEDRIKVQENNKSIEEHKPLVKTWSGIKGLSEEQIRKVAETKARYVANKRKTDPSYTLEDFDSQYRFNPESRSFKPIK